MQEENYASQGNEGLNPNRPPGRRSGQFRVRLTLFLIATLVICVLLLHDDAVATKPTFRPTTEK